MLNTFADCAPAMRLSGWAVLPATGKSPLVKNFNTMGSAPSLYTIDRWAKRWPEKDIVYVPGLCETSKGKGIIVLDPDNADAIGLTEEIFGDTPAKVKTRRGEHRIFAAAGVSLGKLTGLRNCGDGREFEIDIKHGQNGAGIVAGPPSPHEKDPCFHYAWQNCDPSVIDDLPPFPLRKLNAFLEKHPPKTKPEPKLNTSGGFRCDSRGLGLNDYLVAHAWAWGDCDTHQERMNAALDKAGQFNEKLARLGREMLDDDEIELRTAQVIRDLEAGKIERRLGRRATCTSDADEIRALCEFSANGDSAFTLLQLFRAEHDARCKRGETFKIIINAMVETKVLGGWSARKYRDARDLLLQLGLIIQVSPETPTHRAEYFLPDRTLTPSLSVRASC
jgi:hypothetical protein